MKYTRYNPGHYSKVDIELLKDYKLTDNEVALQIGRSRLAVHTKRLRMKAARKLVDTLELVRTPPCIHSMKVKFVAGLGDCVSCERCGLVPYEVEKTGLWIKCNSCGMKSHNQMDVKYKFCSSCNTFHITQNKRTYAGQTK